MTSVRKLPLGLVCTVGLLWTTWWLPPAAAAERFDDLRTLAKQSEQEGDWAKACGYYAYILSKDRTLADVKERFQTCLRHFHRVRRHLDPTYREQVLTQDITTAVRVYGEVLEQLRAEYWEEGRSNLTRLFRQGVEELRLALRDQGFRRQYVPDVQKDAVNEFLARLRENWSRKEVRDIFEAQGQALEIAQLARKSLGLNLTVTVLEFACGACNALDEHTYYLTPRQFGEDAAALRGQTIGIGVEIALDQQRLLISQVYLNSPAYKAGLLPGDRITHIDGIPSETLSLESASDKLKGKAGSNIKLQVISLNDKDRSVTLTRQILQVSVTDYQVINMELGIGYLKLAHFHDNTLAEFDTAIAQLEMQGMKSLVLDLRGNPGGSFDGAVRVAERFLSEGSFIVGTHGRARETKRASHNMNPLLMPLVLLVDGGTASAAEIVAGALRENGRATLIGQTTFGKTTMQHLVELKSVQAGGLRITWARFYTPLGRDEGALGIMPHVLIDRSSRAFDDQLEAALGFLSGR